MQSDRYVRLEVPDLGRFDSLPTDVLDRLIARGAEQAKELDRNIRDQFEMSAADALLRLR